MSTPLVAVHELSFSYPSGTKALDRISLQIEAGERIALVGPNGAGKTTLLWHLTGLLPERLKRRGRGGWLNFLMRAGQGGAGGGEDPKTHPQPQQGREPGIEIDGMFLCEQTASEIRRRVGLVFQDPDDQLFCETVREDVAFGMRNFLARDFTTRRDLEAEVAVRTERALQQFDLLDVAERSPAQLSTGQKKRAALAGVLACEVQLLTLDEPSANLDPRNRRRLMEIIRGYSGAVLIASHDLELVLELAEKVILLDGGCVVASGPARQVLCDERLMEQHGLEVPFSLR